MIHYLWSPFENCWTTGLYSTQFLYKMKIQVCSQGLWAEESSLCSCPEMGDASGADRKVQWLWGYKAEPHLMHPAFQRVYLVWAQGHAHHSQLSSSTVRLCPATMHGMKMPGWAQTLRGLPLTATTKAVFAEGSLNTSHSILGHKTIACPQIHLCWKHTAKIAAIENSVNRTISSTLTLKVPPKTTKTTQNKTCWMKTVKNNFFYCLNKKKMTYTFSISFPNLLDRG